jgi:hypothetical protein
MACAHDSVAVEAEAGILRRGHSKGFIRLGDAEKDVLIHWP